MVSARGSNGSYSEETIPVLTRTDRTPNRRSQSRRWIVHKSDDPDAGGSYTEVTIPERRQDGSCDIETIPVARDGSYPDVTIPVLMVTFEFSILEPSKPNLFG